MATHRAGKAGHAAAGENQRHAATCGRSGGGAVRLLSRLGRALSCARTGPLGGRARRSLVREEHPPLPRTRRQPSQSGNGRDVAGSGSTQELLFLQQRHHHHLFAIWTQRAATGQLAGADERSANRQRRSDRSHRAEGDRGSRQHDGRCRGVGAHLRIAADAEGLRRTPGAGPRRLRGGHYACYQQPEPGGLDRPEGERRTSTCAGRIHPRPGIQLPPQAGRTIGGGQRVHQRVDRRSRLGRLAASAPPSEIPTPRTFRCVVRDDLHAGLERRPGCDRRVGAASSGEPTQETAAERTRLSALRFALRRHADGAIRA